MLSLACRVRPPEIRFSGRKDLCVGKLIVAQAKKTYRTILLVRCSCFALPLIFRFFADRNRTFPQLVLSLNFNQRQAEIWLERASLTNQAAKRRKLTRLK